MLECLAALKYSFFFFFSMASLVCETEILKFFVLNQKKKAIGGAF